MAQNSLIHKCGLLVIGGSAGGLDVILQVLPRLKKTITFPIIIVLHRRNGFDMTLGELLSYKTVLPVKEVAEKDTLQPAHIYIAPPDYHLLIEKDHTLTLDDSEKINYSRPSIDVTFQSAADVFGEELVCVLLSGANADGVDGLREVKEKGGIIVVQNPDTAEVSYMPQQAISSLTVDRILRIEEMSSFINDLP